MNDFLTNLAARSLHANPIVQPRLSARFEPQTSADLPAASPAFGGEVESLMDSSAVATAPSTSAAQPTPAASLLRTPTETNRGHLDPPLSPTIGHSHEPPARDESSAPASAAALRETHRAPPSPIVLRETRVLRETHDVRASDQIVLPVAARELLVQPPSALSLSVRPAAADAFDWQSSHHAPTAEEQPSANKPSRGQSEASSQSSPEPRGTIVAQPRVTPAPAPSNKSEHREIPPESPPMIHVTIGRIEVRAVASSEPVKPRVAAKSHSPSLDDYLRERNGGRT